MAVHAPLPPHTTLTSARLICRRRERYSGASERAAGPDARRRQQVSRSRREVARPGLAGTVPAKHWQRSDVGVAVLAARACQRRLEAFLLQPTYYVEEYQQIVDIVSVWADHLRLDNDN